MRRTAIGTIAATAGLTTAVLVVGVEVADRLLRIAPGRRLLGAIYTRTARRP